MLTPPDLNQRQAEHKEGSFMTFGPRGLVRCNNRPSILVYEEEVQKDGKRGSMSMCEDCFSVFRQQVSLENYSVKQLDRESD